MHVLIHWFGIDDVSGGPYAFWSGVGGDLSIFAVPLVLLRKHNCATRRCWRIGRHPHGDQHFCAKHHPEDR